VNDQVKKARADKNDPTAAQDKPAHHVEERHSEVPEPAIVVVAHDRPAALSRLLGSLSRLLMPSGTDVPLVVSVDGSVEATMDVARRAVWPFGEKQIIARKDRMGLRDHVLACGDLTAEFGTIVMLEDDLYVSPHAYAFSVAASAFYAAEEAIAGISLYAYRLDEYQRLAFHPLDEGYDTFFMQTPSSWGQVWTETQWRGFREWLNATAEIADGRLPRKAAKWPRSSSWKRAFLSYLIDTDRYFVFPSRSLTTNCGDAGEHFGSVTTNLITPLADGPRSWRFSPWSERAVRYDAWFEPMPEVLARRWPGLIPNDVTVDLRGGKAPEQVTSPWLLSSRPSRAPSASFPLLLQPEALNLDLSNQGAFFHLGGSSSFGRMRGVSRRRLTEMLNGEITHGLAVGVLLDRLVGRLKRRQ